MTSRLTRRTRGVSLIGTLVGLFIGLIVTAAATACFHAALLGYRTTMASVRMEESGARALAVLGMIVRQAGWHDGSAMPGLEPVVSGRDNCGQPSVAIVPECGRTGPGRSDALLARFSGAGAPGDPGRPDGSMIDCSGFGVAARMSGGEVAVGHIADNLFYVAADADGEPQLMCRYPSRRQGRIDGSGWTSGALLRGVESLQVRYGIDTDGDGRPDNFLTATEVRQQGNAAWRGVVAVQVAMRLRSQQADPMPQPAPLAQSRNHALADLEAIPAGKAARMRRTFATTIRLRNAGICGETLC